MQAAPTSHQSWTCRQTLTITVGQQLHQAVEAGVTDSAYVSCTAPNGLDRGCHKVLVHAANVGLWTPRQSDPRKVVIPQT